MSAADHYLFTLEGQHLRLLGERALVWEDANVLVVSDVHLGKATHFRKNGIPIPGQAEDAVFRRLSGLLAQHACPRVVFLGDLFHSTRNAQWQRLVEWMADSGREFHLVAGNHDLFPAAEYVSAGMHFHRTSWQQGPFFFRHEPSDAESDGYEIAGHLHPGVMLEGSGRQKLRLPCFWFGKKRAVLPAFGEFTGTWLIQPQTDDQVFALAEGQVYPFRVGT